MPAAVRTKKFVPKPANPQADPPALTNISPGNYHMYLTPMFTSLQGAMPVNVPPLWQSVYVKSIRLGDKDVLNEGLTLERQSDVPLEIVIGANPGSLQGQVLDDQKQPSVGAVITVFADNPAQRIYRTDMYKITSTDTNGRFQLQNLRPGDYRLFAWENVERGTWIDSTFLKIHEDRGVTVRIEEGKSSTVSTTVIRP